MFFLISLREKKVLNEKKKTVCGVEKLFLYRMIKRSFTVEYARLGFY